MSLVQLDEGELYI